MASAGMQLNRRRAYTPDGVCLSIDVQAFECKYLHKYLGICDCVSVPIPNERCVGSCR